MSAARGSTGTAHRLVLFTGCTADSVLHTDSASGSPDFGYDVRLKPEAATNARAKRGQSFARLSRCRLSLEYQSANDDFGRFKAGTLKRQRSTEAGSFP
ncbi:hypothetical protein [uncultured Duncaniella sp.]|uniref:hypothetical protein n=1 Tax=uncultured Duncaniella sp. TaxID=2768039 RepID=UPI0025AF8693|nr:hypothetical protein [uncultured Duncaniella sp.]